MRILINASFDRESVCEKRNGDEHMVMAMAMTMAMTTAIVTGLSSPRPRRSRGRGLMILTSALPMVLGILKGQCELKMY